MEKVEVCYDIPESTVSRLTEIAQTKSMRFAFLTQEMKAFHPLVKCRDYLSDVLHFKPLEMPIGIYGFSLSPEENHLDESATRLLVQVPKGAKNIGKFVDNFPFIHGIEKNLLEISQSKLFSVKGRDNWFVVESDPFWQKCTGLISLLTYLCRVSLYLNSPEDDWIKAMCEGENATSVDGQYMLYLNKMHIDIQIPFFKKLNYQGSTASGFPVEADVNNVHNCAGIKSFICRGQDQLEYYENMYKNSPQYLEHYRKTVLGVYQNNSLMQQLAEATGM